MAEVTVGIDIGTTSVKAIAADADGTVLGRSRQVHGYRTPEPNFLEHDISLAWRDNVRSALLEVAGDHQVQAVCVAAMAPSLGAVAEDASGLTPGLLYGDARGEATPGPSPAENGELIGFLRWCARTAPDAPGYWPAQAVANYALFGEGVIDSTTAITAYPLFDFTNWDEDLTRASGANTSQLPRVVPGYGAAGETPLANGAPVSGGTIDAIGEQIVSGAFEDGDVLVICGATLITWAVIPDWIERPGLWTVPHTTPGKCLIGGPSNAGALFQDWARRWVNVGGSEPPDPRRVPVWTPYVRGERVPLHDPGRRAGLHDLHIGMSGADVMRAAEEAAGFVVRRNLELAGVEGRRLVVTGGGSRSTSLVQALADVTALPADVVAESQGGALGAAFLARITAGLETSSNDAARWARAGHRVEPDPAWLEPCAERYARFVELSGPPFSGQA